MWAIKPVFNRKTKTYIVDAIEGFDLIGMAWNGYYVTDNLVRTYEDIQRGKCEWYKRLSSHKQLPIIKWLREKVDPKGMFVWASAD